MIILQIKSLHECVFTSSYYIQYIAKGVYMVYILNRPLFSAI